MVTKVYKLFAASTANGAASLIIQRRGAITAIKWSAYIDNVSDNAYFHAELSFTSTGQTTTNDTVGPIDEIRLFNNSAATGSTQWAVNQVTNGLAIPVNAGDRLYINTVGNTPSIACYVYVAE